MESGGAVVEIVNRDFDEGVVLFDAVEPQDQLLPTRLYLVEIMVNIPLTGGRNWDRLRTPLETRAVARGNT